MGGGEQSKSHCCSATPHSAISVFCDLMQLLNALGYSGPCAFDICMVLVQQPFKPGFEKKTPSLGEQEVLLVFHMDFCCHLVFSRVVIQFKILYNNLVPFGQFF